MVCREFRFVGCVLLDIYPAREKPIEGINSQMLLDKMKSTNKFLVKKKRA